MRLLSFRAWQRSRSLASRALVIVTLSWHSNFSASFSNLLQILASRLKLASAIIAFLTHQFFIASSLILVQTAASWVLIASLTISSISSDVWAIPSSQAEGVVPGVPAGFPCFPVMKTKAITKIITTAKMI